MTAAIFYNPEAYSINRLRIMGRNVAGASFLRAFFLHSQTTDFWAHVAAADHGKPFEEALRAAGRAEPAHILTNEQIQSLAKPGTLFHPGPNLSVHAWRRAPFGDAAWSVCGITHTTCDAATMDVLTGILTSPVQPWDALICTSQAVKEAVNVMLSAQADYLAERLGSSRTVLPQLPVIPLGVHVEDFAFTAADRQAARRELRVDADTMVVLYVGRLNFTGKAHPLAMYQALQRAAAGRKLVLLQCGQHTSDASANAHADAARLVCPAVEVRTLHEAGRRRAWAGADVFCSLADSVQESFGLTPIEAMAAGLPVVVSDWNGYRDTVRHGIDGFRIPTVMPQKGLGRDLVLRYALQVDPYEFYCGHTAAFISVDVDATARAFDALFNSNELRRRMGEAGARRARAVFDWAIVMKSYEELWSHLEAARRGARATVRNRPWPGRSDPFDVYRQYATNVLSAATKLTLVDANAAAAKSRLLELWRLDLVRLPAAVLPAMKELELVLERLGHGATSAEDLVRTISTERRALVLRALLWLAKINIVRIVG